MYAGCTYYQNGICIEKASLRQLFPVQTQRQGTTKRGTLSILCCTMTKRSNHLR